MGDSQEVRGFVFRQNGAPLPFNGNGFSLSYDYLSSAPDLGFQAFDGSGMANTSARHGPNIQSGTEPMISSGLNYAFNQFAPGRVSLRQRPSEANSGDSYSHLPDHRLTQPLPDSTTLGFKTLLDAYNQGQYNWPDTSDIAVSSFQQTPLFGQEDDTRSVISESTDCDSHCQLGDPCTGEACANEVDACTDKNCPEKNCPDTDCPAKLPSEVADAAATLAAIGGDLDCPPPRYPICQGGELYPSVGRCFAQTYIMFLVNIDTFGISESQNPFADELWPSSPWDPWKDIANHILGAHSDPSSSNCTRPCVIDDPHVFQHCHFYNALTPHVEHYSLTDTPFGGHGHGSANLPFQNDMKLEECGAEIPSPEALVEHFISEHRLTFEKALAQGNARADGSQPLFSERISSDSSTNAFESSIVPSLHSSPHDTFPPTPLSLSQETTEPSISSSHSRLNSASQLAAGTEWEQRCLWCCQEGGSPCGRIFNDSEALFDHVNTEHIQKLDKGPKGFLCCWENCKRLGDGKDGFPQRSKIERHMHTHIGCKRSRYAIRLGT